MKFTLFTDNVMLPVASSFGVGWEGL